MASEKAGRSAYDALISIWNPADVGSSLRDLPDSNMNCAIRVMVATRDRWTDESLHKDSSRTVALLPLGGAPASC